MLAANKGENPLNLANQAHEINMPMQEEQLEEQGEEQEELHIAPNKGSDASSVLLPTFRRAIIAFRAQLPLLYAPRRTLYASPLPALLQLPPPGRTLRIRHVARP